MVNEFCNFFLYFACKIEIYFAKLFCDSKFCKFNYHKIGNINFSKKNWKLILKNSGVWILQLFENYFIIQQFAKFIFKNSDIWILQLFLVFCIWNWNLFCKNILWSLNLINFASLIFKIISLYNSLQNLFSKTRVYEFCKVGFTLQLVLLFCI